ncbi:hypothetical protein V1517DRAFT_191176 [Lipomyces orientalis]|uniref:Uncharacterized protein n=1 Tax=Lipomyces orientalis TaxID=1233043 RepID=A0ACC3TVY3_9ASCO
MVFVRGSRSFTKPLSRGLLSTRSRDLAVRIISTSNQTESASEYESFFPLHQWALGLGRRSTASRQIFFNITELQNVATEVVGSDSCVSMITLAEGGYNKAFRLLMNDRKAVIARIPNPNAGPPFYMTASEVATMELVRTALQVPVPQVYGWSATSNNRIGSEYVIMEEAAWNSWDKLTPDSKLLIMKEVVSVETKLLCCSFLHYGNIYFASNAVKGGNDEY